MGHLSLLDKKKKAGEVLRVAAFEKMIKSISIFLITVVIIINIVIIIINIVINTIIIIIIMAVAIIVFK